MVVYDLLAENVSERLAPRFDTSDKQRDEQFEKLTAQYTRLKAGLKEVFKVEDQGS